MGVYINIEMPTSCGYCPLRHEARDGDECYLGASLTEYQKRPDNCPLVPVKPHGRLIDADALRYWADDSAMIAFDYVTRSQINAAPTIIPATEGET